VTIVRAVIQRKDVASPGVASPPRRVLGSRSYPPPLRPHCHVARATRTRYMGTAAGSVDVRTAGPCPAKRMSLCLQRGFLTRSPHPVEGRGGRRWPGLQQVGSDFGAAPRRRLPGWWPSIPRWRRGLTCSNASPGRPPTANPGEETSAVPITAVTLHRRLKLKAKLRAFSRGELLVAAQRGSEAQNCGEKPGGVLVADGQSAVAGQPGEGPLDDPAVAAKSSVGLHAATGDARRDGRERSCWRAPVESAA
jgi:hypothetical protein